HCRRARRSTPPARTAARRRSAGRAGSARHRAAPRPAGHRSARAARCRGRCRMPAPSPSLTVLPGLVEARSLLDGRGIMPATPAWPPESLPRLYVEARLGEGVTLTLEGKAANYLGAVLRLK